MADRLYLRHSTDKQTDARQRHALAALLAAGAPAYEDPATSSRVLSLYRDGFKRLLDEAAVGDTIRIADAARLFRSVADIIALRPVLIRRGLHLRVESGLLSGIDLASDDPGTKMMVNVLAAVLEFQRDMISENTREGVAAAAASGKTLGRPSAFSEKQVTAITEAFHAGAAVKALAREHGVDPHTIRRALDYTRAREVPENLDPVGEEEATTPGEAPAGGRVQEADPVVSVDVPGLVAEHLVDVADEPVRQALDAGQTIRRGQGYSVRVTAPVSVHVAMVEHTATALMQSPAGRKAHRIHSDRVTGVRITP
ncbi:recombinase family protein [Streptomyces cyaneofuscatus]|uniref:Recombinase family protein n=1 Tax=Streptomyces cyaneofuscatus TaxID=66883 RepID=A0ABZ1F8X6_9ACTN|nr:recombinase family protein [Streptomyces cyaneofuscatus]WSB12621.1 recombinase family protein [Streptomyces cyaneofuscatus]WSD51163.1 recombinase family protein [Streptomyces cyaneofuscatus]WSD51194.1 recombinase family protein [Streptomyces cyaneofuscatus]